jgi:hypothetical protein
MPISKLSTGHIAGTAKGSTVEYTKTTDAKNRNVTRTTTRGGEKTATETTARTHTSRKDNEFTKTKTKDVDVKKSGIDHEYKANLVETSGTMFEAGAKEKRVTTEKGGVKLDAYAQGPSFKMDGEASISKKGFGVDIDVALKIDATLVKGGASAEKEFKFKVNGEEVAVKVNLGAEGQVGINGELRLTVHVGKDGVSVKAGADGFAGAKGTLTGGISVSVNGREDAKGEIKLTAAAGAMAGAEFEGGLSSFKAKAYAAVGVGVGIEISGSVNAGNIARSTPGLLLPGTQGW